MDVNRIARCATILIAVCALAACRRESAPPVESAPRTNLRFAWPDKATARVIETMTKKGNVVKLAYRIRLSATSDPSLLQLDFLDIVPLQLNGVDLRSAEAKQALGPALNMMRVVPAMIVTRDGEYRDLGSIDVAIQTTLAFLHRDGRPVTERQKANDRAMMASSEFREMIVAKSADRWQSWVEFWIGDAPPNGENEIILRHSILGGRTVETQVTESNTTTDSNLPGVIRLHAEFTEEGTDWDEAMRAYLAKIEQVPGAKKFDDMLSGSRRHSNLDITMDAETMKPELVRSETTFSTDDAVSTNAVTEVHEYVFAWTQ